MAIVKLSTAQTNFEWFDMTSPTEGELLEFGEKYHIHRYAIKDCLEPDHLPKFECQENYNFIISRIMTVDGNKEGLHTIQQLTSKVAIFYHENWILTIHRLPVSFIEEIKNKYLSTEKPIQTSEIVVRILWYVLQTYERPMHLVMEEIDFYEERIFLKNLSPAMLKNLYFIKRKVNIALRLLQQTANILPNIHSKDKVALHDLQDMHLKLQSVYHQNMDDVHSLLNFYLSISSQKTNEVMRILTVFSAFFLPLTFIAGVYGMNFEFMPELKHKLGYPLTWGAMIFITLIIFQWFWRKKWL